MALSVPTFLSEHLQAPVAVFGGGVSGRAVLDLVEALGATGVHWSQSSMSGVRASGPSPSHGRVARALRPE